MFMLPLFNNEVTQAFVYVYVCILVHACMSECVKCACVRVVWMYGVCARMLVSVRAANVCVCMCERACACILRYAVICNIYMFVLIFY